MPEVYRGRKSRGRKSGRKSPRKYSKGRKSGRKSPRYSRGRNRFRGVTYRGDNTMQVEQDIEKMLTESGENIHASNTIGPYVNSDLLLPGVTNIRVAHISLGKEAHALQNWYSKSVNPIIVYHATPLQSAESIVKTGFREENPFVKLNMNGIGYGFSDDDTGALIEAVAYAQPDFKWNQSYTVPRSTIFVTRIFTFEKDRVAPPMIARQARRPRSDPPFDFSF